MPYPPQRQPLHTWKANAATRKRTFPIPTSHSAFRRRLPARFTYLVISITLIVLFWRLHTSGGNAEEREYRAALERQAQTRRKTDGANTYSESSDREGTDHTTLPSLPCRDLPGADDVLVVMRTGSTEIEDKLPIHLTTTFRCYPHYLLFSDYAERFHNEEVLDALAYVDPEIQSTHPDFELWRRLREGGGRKALKSTERSGPISRPQDTNTGKRDNPGWKLDKWKFLPMMNSTLHAHPEKKWYVFVETDTYILWQTLLNYLAVLPAEKNLYMGGQIWIGDVLFAHGGTGFAVSRPALEKVVEHYVANQGEWEEYTDSHWAGDCVLGKAFRDSGTPLTSSWPIWQADDIGNMNYARDEAGLRVWCLPTISYHHLSPSVVKELWEFEQGWMREVAQGDPKKILWHKDMYAQYVLPRIKKSGSATENWDNHADIDQGPVHSLEACRSICEDLGEKECVQFSVSVDLRCLTTAKPNLGEWRRGVDSGWIYERMERVWSGAKWCGIGKGGWIMP